MTERLYYTDRATCREFDADVVEQTTHEGQVAPSSCDRTAFYPTSGGQPFDVGTLSGANVARRRRHGGRPDPARRRSRCRTATAVSRRDRLGAPLRSHAAAHRPARAVGRVRSAAERADRELPSRRRLLDDRPGARAVSGRDRAGRSRGQPRRVGGPAGRDSLRGTRRDREAAAPEGTQARGDAAPDRRAGLRPVRLRRHRTWRARAPSASSPWPRPSGSAADRGSPSCAAGARSRAIAPSGTPSPGACARCRCCPRSCPPPSSACRRTAGICAGRSGLPGRSSRARRPTRWRTPRPRRGDPARRRASLPGWDAAGLKLIAARIVERPGHVAILVGDPPPRADRRARGRRDSARLGRPAAPAGRAPRRQGRRPARARAGRRHHVRGRRRATVRTGSPASPKPEACVHERIPFCWSWTTTPPCSLLVDVLAEKMGFRVKAVSSGLQALEHLRDGLQPHVILLDIMMERIDGLTFMNHLREMPSRGSRRRSWR